MTTLVNNTEWLTELRTRLPGVSEGQIGVELKATLREFFTKSGFWVEELNPIDIIASKTLYKLSYPQARVMGVHRVWVDNMPTKILTIKPKFVDDTAGPRGAYMAEADLLQLFPAPTIRIDNGLKVYARLNPLPEMTNVPVATVSHFFDEVLDGVLGRLYSQPNKPYTNLLQSQYHLKRFRDGIAVARDMGRKRYSSADQEWSYPGGWS